MLLDSPDLPIDFLLFSLMLLGIVLFSKYSLSVALSGFAAITLHRIFADGVNGGMGLSGWIEHVGSIWVTSANLLGLLTGCAVLTRHVEKSRLPLKLLPHLPQDWKAGPILLMIVYVVSGYFGSIAATLVGVGLIYPIFNFKLHTSYVVGIIVAANAGGAGSVLGNLTTTMIWNEGISPMSMAYSGFATMIVFAIVAALVSPLQHAHSPIVPAVSQKVELAWRRLFIVACVMLAGSGSLVLVKLYFPLQANKFPFAALAVWLAIAATSPLALHDWRVMPNAFKGAIFAIALAMSATLMPISMMKIETWHNVFGLGFVSGVFGSIPLTELAIRQGGYDWDFFVYAVGVGGSMVWFGSPAGVALTNLHPEVKNAVHWVKYGWPVLLGYVVGFFLLLFVFGWHIDEQPTYTMQAAAAKKAKALQSSPVYEPPTSSPATGAE
ncbi:MAG TPA: citrate transporter [Rhodocyclaceae bacterium]|nr:citrate transporter [Rhodocyclaceae bacterium]